ncbi:hypothetical protein EVAR_55845_1 [Eumeta japonica]|uniref:Uncharacterized protein n=1 Tax=Eumeta variegata TaxID=151549 RepID=A0A4C1ZE64_EUMVA|nr:hypothetical protein EVAR_55845_1 [Eumeta japonica]
MVLMVFSVSGTMTEISASPVAARRAPADAAARAQFIVEPRTRVRWMAAIVLCYYSRGLTASSGDRAVFKNLQSFV